MHGFRQRNSNIRKLIALIVLSACVPLALWWVSDRSEMVPPDLFKAKDLAHIDKVVLRSQGDTVILTFDGGSWQVNNSFSADEDMITVLFATLDQAVSKRPIESVEGDSLRNLLKHNGTLVELWKGNSVVEKFYAGGNQRRGNSYFMDTAAEIPYQVVIPGYYVYVSAIFEQPAMEWRSKRVFEMNWRNFARLTAKFPRVPSRDFGIEMKGGMAQVTGEGASDTAKVNDYLDKVSLLFVDNYVFPAPADSLSMPPQMKLQIYDASGNVHELTVFGEKDQRRIVRLGGGTWARMSDPQLESILKGRSFFQ